MRFKLIYSTGALEVSVRSTNELTREVATFERAYGRVEVEPVDEAAKAAMGERFTPYVGVGEWP